MKIFEILCLQTYTEKSIEQNSRNFHATCKLCQPCQIHSIYDEYLCQYTDKLSPLIGLITLI